MADNSPFRCTAQVGPVCGSCTAARHQQRVTALGCALTFSSYLVRGPRFTFPVRQDDTEWLGHKRRIGRKVGEPSAILTSIATAIGDVPQFEEGKRANACCWTNIDIN